tara:strand:+ start:813 stop:1415 length:603 start_codon:yes stop_codon:yes gene_type:complete
MEDIVYGLFPTPVFKTKITPLTEGQKETVFNNIETVQQENNIRSKDLFILNNPCLSLLKKEVESSLERYKEQIISPRTEVSFPLTNSWGIATRPGEKHHMHHHPNAFLSGVIYLQTLSKDYLKFIRDGQETIQIFSSELNPFNSRTWSFPVEDNDLLIFPSHFRHAVDTNTQEKSRCTIAFNTWIKGTIGCKEVVSELIL